MKNGFVKSTSVLSLLLISANAFSAIIAPGQAPIAVQSTDTGRTSKRLQIPLSQLPVSTAPVQQESKEPTVNPQMAKIRFVLTHVKFKGNTVYSSAELEKIFSPSYHKSISLADLQNLVGDVTKKYRSDGYILSRAILPPQEINHGEVTVQIVEGFISSITVQGNPGKTKALIEAYGGHVLETKPLKISTLERYTLIANDLPGMTVKAVLTPSKTVPGGADLTYVVDRSYVDAYISYDNYGTRFLGPQEVTLSGNVYSALAAGDNNALRLVTTARQSEMQFAELIHAQPWGTQGVKWMLGSDYSVTQPQFTLAPFDIVGRSFLLFGDVSGPIIRSRSENLYWHTMANYQNVTSTLLGDPFYQDRFRTLVVGLGYDKADSWRGFNTVGFDLEHGFPYFGAHDHVEQSRPDGKAVFTKINGLVSRLQGISNRFSLLGALHGQYSFEPLLATEQFGFGGSDYGRGYDPSEIVGDRGFGAKVEFRMDTAPEFHFLNSVQYYVFYDAGKIWNIDKGNLPANQSATSLGIGARITFIKNLTGNVYFAKPLTYPVATQVALGESGNLVRGFFQVTLSA